MFGDYITIFKARILLKNVLYKKLLIKLNKIRTFIFLYEFRIIVVIPLSDTKKFSNASRSRLTVIYTKLYLKDEKKTVIRNLYTLYLF
jgi:hypothetical protein